MTISCDPAKRAKTLAERGLDFYDAALVCAGTVFTREDDRFDYGERRFVTVGELRGWVIVFVWTPRRAATHVLSMRKANARESRLYRQALARS